jgi:hypothetical protein
MNNYSNIYDIDGKLIRSVDDTHKWTVQEVKDKIEYYRQKLLKLAENDKKAVIYATYMRNLSNYLFILYSQMTAEQLNAEIEEAKKVVTAEQVKKAMEELANEVNNDRKTTEDTTNEIPEQHPGDNKGTTDEESGDVTPIDGGDSDLHEERTLSQSDLLVERDGVSANMDEYVDFEDERIK